MSAYYSPGPGDEATWGPCRGHGGDPRTDLDDERELLHTLIDMAIDQLGRASRALDDGETQVAVDLMRDAGRDLAGIDDADVVPS
jgi:hypothetical protein